MRCNNEKNVDSIEDLEGCEDVNLVKMGSVSLK